MTSKYQRAYVWIWLPAAAEPVVAGQLSLRNDKLVFNYGQTYLKNKNAIPIYDNELPLKAGTISPKTGLNMPGCIRDASPDAWGRRIIINKIMSKQSLQDYAELDELTYLLESGSDRIGALDFQHSADDYQPRSPINTSLDELLESAKKVEQGLPLTDELDQALQHGTSIGGARPKALIEQNDKKYIAKFSSTSDLYSVVKAEYVAMKLAKAVGLNVAEVLLTTALHKDVLLIERFDRVFVKDTWQRRCIISALTLMELDEMMARYTSYEQLTQIIRANFADSTKDLRELFSRLVFNILCGNNDDHARNHAAFWDGVQLSLTPAYDICPQNRTGGIASQAMLIHDNQRSSQILTCIDAAHHFLLSEPEALQIIEHQIKTIGENWSKVCERANLSEIDRRLLWGRQFLNHFAFESLESNHRHLVTLADDIRAQHMHA